MGFFNLQEIIDAYKQGELEAALEDFDMNDLAYLKRELEGYCKKHNLGEQLKGLLDQVQKLYTESMEE